MRIHEIETGGGGRSGPFEAVSFAGCDLIEPSDRLPNSIRIGASPDAYLISLEEGDAIARIRDLRRADPDAKIIALVASLDLELDLLAQALQEGAIPVVGTLDGNGGLQRSLTMPRFEPERMERWLNPQTASRTSVVIPAKNESGNIGWVLDHLPAFVHEVILVDGNSTDGTVETARAIRKDIIVVNEERPGKGSALRAGFARATGDIIVMIDADGSMVPAEMRRMLYLLDDGFDFVKGSRFMAGGSSEDITWLRGLGNHVLVSLVNRLFGARFTDLCYGFCGFHRTHLAALDLDSDGFEIETEIVLHALKAQLNITEVPSLELERRSGASNLRTVRDGMRVLRTILRERLRRKRLQSAEAPGSAVPAIDVRAA